MRDGLQVLPVFVSGGEVNLVKLCRDCAFVRIGWLERWLTGYENAKCAMSERDPVDGRLRFCSNERRSILDHKCGVVGKYWEPK
jgi:hypothetical protein